ncbi:NAD(P)/FAD-dependent oxidoreductase [Pedobacter sp. KR3-3]|uniref:Flavin-dependent monooxygenase n=1 Tax=Pedobacter albus TaxID=3113905 RepID=A0ABU7I428_9SPHI|nr:NAD(P)/FAD-dependent oxidoreductase [Pedobacter sp. KR3-3]MEE1944217.1 NAD(P)/FAD-dependent oxidoreductase [Pedobacter sp. KR3-3]
MLDTQKNIAIIGGGPGGLTLARLLQIQGVKVKVYERDANKEVRVQGATLDLHEESGLKALAKAGLMDAFKANYRPGAGKMRIVDHHGTIWHDDATDEREETRPEIDRGPLRKILLDSLQPETVVWDSHFKSLVPNGNGWTITFKNGTSAFADIVIAADGANSKIRSFITPIKAFYSGVTMVEGVVYQSAVQAPNLHQLLNGGKIFALEGGKTLIVSSKGDASLVFYTGCKTDEHWCKEIDFSDKTQVLQWFKSAFAGWSEAWLELFEKASLPLIARPQYCMPLDQTWETLPNLTMLGDAAHMMPPFAGEGVNMAMLDALELSECLAKYSSVVEAISRYEKEMRQRASATAKDTLDQTESMHTADGLKNMLEMFAG